MAKPILYTYFRSSCSWRVRIALAWKGIDYEPRFIHLIKDGGEQHSDEFKKINPMEQIPALDIGQAVISQSIAIMEYLEEAYPEKPLLPKDPLLRARVREMCQIINSGVQPLQNLGVLQKLDESKRSEWARHFISNGFRALEQLMTTYSGDYCFGDSVTMADCCLVPQVFGALRFKVDMSGFPNIQRVTANLEKLEAFQAADAKNQPDCPASGPF